MTSPSTRPTHDAAREARPSESLRTAAPSWLPPVALLVDAVLVVAFVAVGQREHKSSDGLLSLVTTASPFLISLIVASLAVGGFSAVSRRWTRVWPHGVVVWLVTLAGGMGLRVAMGLGGAPVAFIIVAAISLAVVLLGRRVITTWVSKYLVK